MELGSKLVYQTRVFASIIALAVLTVSVNAQTIYKKVNADGTITYTDQPLPGSEPVDLSGVHFSSVPTLATSKSAKTSYNKNSQNNAKYKVEVLSPSPESTVRNNAGQMSISGALSPAVNNSEYHLYLDNKKVSSQKSGTFALDGVNRGAHTFYISVTDNRGKTLASSEPQTFYMQQISILTNPGTVN